MISLKSVGQMSRTGGLLFVLLSAVAGSTTASAQTLTTLANFNGGTVGANPVGSLVADANGDLFGTAETSPGYGTGTVFEILNTTSGYASIPITLASFNGSTVGGNPAGGLIADANGDLFGTDMSGGAYGQGTVFEIFDTAGTYASTPATLVSFSFNETGGQSPQSGLIADGNGNLFGTTPSGGMYAGGTVFEIVNSAGTYASTPTVLVNFNGSDGAFPFGRLMEDTNGSLFGTTGRGGAYGYGTVFEIAKTTNGYASAPITLASFNGTDGDNPQSGVIADANGNLFGTTTGGGAYRLGTVFEIVNTAGTYASTPTTLVSFNGPGDPMSGVIADANGNLFGTTSDIRDNGGGTVFEIVNSGGVYASTPTILASFEAGSYWLSGLIADANGNLFGATEDGGAYGIGTVFELTSSGFVPPIRFAGTPGSADCTGKTLSTLAHTYGGIAHAAPALNYANVSSLQSAVASYCSN